MSSSILLMFVLFIVISPIYHNNINAMNNGLARTPPMGWDTYNLYKGNFNSEILESMADALNTTGMRSVGYNRINVDGGWVAYDNITNSWIRNSSGYLLPNPSKFPNGIQKTIDYIHSRGLLWGHYTNAGVNACGGAQNSSEYWITQDISLFAEWKIDMLKIDNCAVVGNDTEIIFQWSRMLNETGRSILVSDCRNQCQNDAEHRRVDWKPYCINITNMWRISTDINPAWVSMLHNLDCGKSFGKWAQPGAWTDLDFLEVDIGAFRFTGDNSSSRLRMNEAHFSLWCIISAPLFACNDLRSMANEILGILTNVYALAVNQNYVYNAGDVITEFNLSEIAREHYVKETIGNKNMTEMFFKPLPNIIIGVDFYSIVGAFVFLNRDMKVNYSMDVLFSDLPLFNERSADNVVECHGYDIWSDIYFYDIQFKAELYPMSVKFVILFNCTQL